MKTILKIVNDIKNNEEKVIGNIDKSDLQTYKFIQQEFMKGDVSCNEKFQSRFMSFYRLYGAGLTSEFKKVYFNLMQENRSTIFFSQDDIKEIIYRLYEFKNAKGLNCIHFSFTTKLMHTINNNLPIYDSKIRDCFSFKTPYLHLGNEVRVDEYLKQYEIIKTTYNSIIRNNLLDSTIVKFKIKFFDYKISNTKILDFLLWSTGKLFNKNEE